MKKGKAADVFELTVENILYGGDELLYIIHKIIVAITREGHIPDLLKTGLLTPIFKNKGSKLPYSMFSTVNSKTSAAFPFFITDNAVLISSYVGSCISSCVINSVII
jgi:hypothetical protein